MKTLFAIFALILASAGFGQAFGGNLPSLRPNYTTADEVQFDLALSYLETGQVARASTVPHEVLWNPVDQPNFRGLDAMIVKMKAKGVVPLFLLMPCPYPSSPWYAPPHNDWWLPRPEVWDKAIALNVTIVKRIQAAWRSPSLTSRDSRPLYQLWNEPAKGKPGGSITSVYGEWTDRLHEFLFKIATSLKAAGISKSQIVGPAISTLGESTYATTSELLSSTPPDNLNWSALCGYRSYHLRFGASWSKGDSVEIRRAFQFNIDNLYWVDSKLRHPSGQKIMLTEFYVSPADCGVAIGTDMYPFHSIVFDLLSKSKFTHAVAWGLRPGETDEPGNPWLTYGGVGDSLVKWLAARNPANLHKIGN
jgi:hypothetical protein